MTIAKYYYSVILIISIIFNSCSSSSYRIEINEDLYWKFSHFEEHIDYKTEVITLSIKSTPITIQEKDILLSILNEWGWEYVNCESSSVFISRNSCKDIITLKKLDEELLKRATKNNN